jgi:hypothetical protein
VRHVRINPQKEIKAYPVNLPGKIDALIVSIQRELKRHNWDSFAEEIASGKRIAVPGCTLCQKQIATTGQFVDHLANDVVPALFDGLRSKSNH